MNREKHWQRIYGAKPASKVTWYTPHLKQSLAMIRVVSDTSAEIIDVGGGASTLVDDLLDLGYTKVTVLDVSSAALVVARERLGPRAKGVTWITSDVTKANLPNERYDVWHDRAVFHFLTEPEDRKAYVELANRSIKPGGHLILATFSLEGPTCCSGLDVIRYSCETLRLEFGPTYVLRQEVHETHLTPAGRHQKFIYCLFEKTKDVW